MKKNLLIIGAGIYGMVAKEIAESMGVFEGIAFADDQVSAAPDGTAVVGGVADIAGLSDVYGSVAVAIGNSDVRLRVIREIEESTSCEIAALISPQAYVSPSARVARGCIVEPMAVVHAGCVLEMGCIVSAGAVINHASTCGAGVHVDCNATVAGYMSVPEKTKVCSGEIFRGEASAI